jgi:uncharacterized protein
MTSLSGFAIAFGEVRHQRLRPARNAFRYRAFFLRIPIHRLNGEQGGGWLFGLNRAGLLSFHEADHGDGGATAGVWLRRLLGEAGIVADGEIWLNAFPRVLGYAFKPVSFWLCHRADGALVAVVAEVNNTFGERHCYLLADGQGRPLKDGAERSAVKQFHVSPFCGTDGRYRFRFKHAGDHPVFRIDYDDAAGPLLLTSMSGRLRPLDNRACAHALAWYPLFTLAVIARIHWQALKLWMRGVPFYRKPAPPSLFVSNSIE